jgi:hypothetical protein
MANAYPTQGDLIRFLYAANLIDSATAPTGRAASLPYEAAVDGARAEFESRTNRTYRAAAASVVYDPPTDGDALLDLEGDWATITSITRDGDLLVAEDDYRLRPLDGPPYRFVEFIAGQSAPLPWSTRGTVTVTGTRGSAATVPDDVYQAVLQRAAAMLAPSLQGILTRGAQSVKQADASITFAGGKALGALSQEWQDTFERVVATRSAAGLIF